jgi:hypothetical protein
VLVAWKLAQLLKLFLLPGELFLSDAVGAHMLRLHGALTAAAGALGPDFAGVHSDDCHALVEAAAAHFAAVSYGAGVFASFLALAMCAALPARFRLTVLGELADMPQALRPAAPLPAAPLLGTAEADSQVLARYAGGALLPGVRAPV